jgi:hypothetical protein
MISEMRLVTWEAGAGWRVPNGDRLRLNQRIFRKHIEAVKGPVAYQAPGQRGEAELVHQSVTVTAANMMHWIETRDDC